MPPTTPRRYDASRRQADAADRRARIVEAAQHLFLTQGYGATSIAAIAEAADVSTPTVYAQFESKAGILARMVGVAVAGDFDDAGLARERPDFEPVVGPGVDARDRIAAGVRLTRQIHERGARLVALAESVAGVDAAVGELARVLRDQSRSDALAVASAFAPGELRAGLDAETAADIIWTVGGADVYMMLVDHLGKTPDEYEAWLHDRMVDLLLPPAQPL
jgi:AcrR family transcriptional regulator